MCAICGGPFDCIEIRDVANMSEDDLYLVDVVYDSRVLDPTQAEVSGS